MDQKTKYQNVSMSINVYYVMRSIGYSYDKIVRMDRETDLDEIKSELKQMESKRDLIQRYINMKKESIWKYHNSKYFGFYVNDIDEFISYYREVLQERGQDDFS